MQSDVSPEHILQIGFGFWASKTLLSAVDLAVFSQLSEGPKSGSQLQATLGLHPRHLGFPRHAGCTRIARLRTH